MRGQVVRLNTEVPLKSVCGFIVNKKEKAGA